MITDRRTDQRSRPRMTIAGGIMGVMTDAGRVLSRVTGDSYVVESWLENDGDTATQEEAAARLGLVLGERIARAEVGGKSVLLVRGKQALAETEGCGGADILVTDQEAGERPCIVFDPAALRESGAMAAWPQGRELRLVSAEALAGDRPWTRPGRNGPRPDLATEGATP